MELLLHVCSIHVHVTYVQVGNSEPGPSLTKNYTCTTILFDTKSNVLLGWTAYLNWDLSLMSSSLLAVATDTYVWHFEIYS